MRDNDIIEKIHGIYDEKEPDVLSRLNFSSVEMMEPPERKLNRRYISAAAVYAAACLVVVVALPFIIGGAMDEPETSPGNSNHDIKFETIATGDSTVDMTERYIEDTTLAETEQKDESEPIEMTESDTTEEQTTPPEITVPVVYPTPEEPSSDPVVEDNNTGNVDSEEYIPVQKPEPEKKPEIVDPTPENMVEKKADIPYTLIRYSGGWVESLSDMLQCDPVLQEYGYSGAGLNTSTITYEDNPAVRVIKTKNQFDALAAQIRDGLEADLINEGAFAEFAKDFEYYNEEYFEKYDLVFWGLGETVHGIEYDIRNSEVDYCDGIDFTATNGKIPFFLNDMFDIQLEKALPSSESATPSDVAAANKTTELVLFAFNKDDVKDVTDDMRLYRTNVEAYGETRNDKDKFYYQAPYSIDVTEEEAYEIAKEELGRALPGNGGLSLLGYEYVNMYDYTCELTTWKWDNEIPVYHITFYATNNSFSKAYKIVVQVFANERSTRSSEVIHRFFDNTDAIPTLVSDFEITERAVPGITWITDKEHWISNEKPFTYTYYEYADTDSMIDLWNAGNVDNSEYNKTFGNLVGKTPYLVFDNYEDYSSFIKNIKSAGNYTEGSEAYDFLMDSEKYNEEYFKDNALTIVGIKNKYSSIDNRMIFGVYEDRNVENKLNIYVGIRSFAPGLADIEDYEITEEDEAEYKMYVFEIERREGVEYNFEYAYNYTYDSDNLKSHVYDNFKLETITYIPPEEKLTYYVNKNK